MGPAGRGARGSRDGHPRRPRDRGCIRAPERSSQGPDRQCALETARDRRALEAVPARAFLPHHRHAPARRHTAPDCAPDGRGAAPPAVAGAVGDGEPGGQRRPSRLRSDGSQRPHHDHRPAHARRRREKRQHGRNDGENRGVSRRGNRALDRLVRAVVRAPTDGGDRPGDRRDCRSHVHADLRTCREPEVSRAEAKQISSREIEQARSAATAARRRLVEVLEAKLGLDPDTFVARLGATLRIQVMRMEELRGAAPAFDVLPFSEGSQRGCALVRGEAGALWLVTDDPFSGEQQAWAEERIPQEFSRRLVHRGDLGAVLAELDITERRVPQDGRFKALDRGRAVDFRVSIMPNIYGEDAVLRVLDKQSLYESTQQQLSLDSLGFETDDIRALRRLSHEPYGMLLVTGPTGSGKTTTLYAAITEINNGQDKIVTIEDPVEYQLAGVLQIPVNEKKGLTFARGLRSILRHDPDKIMVGEIRDPETANIAVQSALTGHLVFTTVHANNVFDVIGRFMHMNVDLYGFVSALNAILAQRLLRLICPHCREDS